MPSPFAFFSLCRWVACATPFRVRTRVRSRGQGMVEYALIIALIALVAIGALALLGPAIGAPLGRIVENLRYVIGPPPATPRR